MTAAEKQKTDEQVLKEKMAEAYRIYQRNIREADHLVYELTKGARGDVPEKELLETALAALDRCDYGDKIT